MTDRRIVLVGFMGCGKTTVARELARRIGCDFVDLDTFITETHGRSPAEIIQQDGEPAFRAMETSALNDVLHQNEIRVIALGGGAWTIPANRTLVAQQNCLSVWLDAPFDLCWQRISSETKTTRPLAPHREAAQERFESRRADYAFAELPVEVSAEKQIREILAEIMSAMS